MDHFWLTFKDSRLERRFEIFAAEGSLLLQDRVFLFSSLASTLWAMIELDFDGTSFAVAAPLVLYALWLLLDLALRNALGPKNLVPFRTALVVATRLVLSIAHALRSPHWLPGAVAEAEPANIITTSLSAIGVWSEFAMAIGLPLKFKSHLLLQLFMVLIFLYFTSASCCRQLMESPAKSAIAQMALRYRGPFSGFFDTISPTPGTAAMVSAGQASCQRLLLLSHVYFGFGLCSYIVWCWERNARCSFVGNASSKGGKNLPKIAMIAKPTIAVQVAVILAGFCICWKAMIDLMGIIIASESSGV